MKKQFLKMAGVSSENEFYKLYPNPEDFFNQYPEARAMSQMAKGGMTSAYLPAMPSIMDYSKMAQGGEATQQGQDAQQQLIMKIAEQLQAGTDPQLIVQELVKMKIPEEQAMQLVQAIDQKIKQQAGAAGGAEQQPQQMMKYGGYSGTYDAGSGSYFKRGGETCPPGMEYDYDIEECVPINGGQQLGQPGNVMFDDRGMGLRPNNFNNYNSRIGINNPRFGTGYGVSYNPQTNGYTHDADFNVPTLFKVGKNSASLDGNLMYSKDNESKFSQGSVNFGLPLSRRENRQGRLTMGGGYNASSFPGMPNQTGYNANIGYSGNIGGEKGTRVNVNFGYNGGRRFEDGGMTDFNPQEGGEYDLSDEQINDLIKKGYKIKFM